MYTDEDKIEIRTIANMTLSIIFEHDIMATPSNYELIYQFVQGDNQELVHELDELLTYKSFPEDLLDELAQKHFKSPMDEEIEKLKADVSLLVKTLFSQMDELSGKTGTFEKSLEGSLKDLTTIHSLEDLKGVIHTVRSNTKNMGSTVINLKKKLEDTQKELSVLKEQFEDVKSEIFVDALTQLDNRKSFDENMESMSQEATSEKQLALLMIDIDFFKKFNDTYGHLVGDKVLQFVGKVLKKQTGAEGLATRFGGEEFAILLPDTTFTDAMNVAERIRHFLYSKTLTLKGANDTVKKQVNITVSIGVSLYQQEYDTIATFIERADKGLYFAKENGRSCIGTENDIM